MKALGHISVPTCENKTLSMRKWFAKDSRRENSNNYKGFQWLARSAGRQFVSLGQLFLLCGRAFY